MMLRFTTKELRESVLVLKQLVGDNPSVIEPAVVREKLEHLLRRFECAEAKA